MAGRRTVADLQLQGAAAPGKEEGGATADPVVECCSARA